MTLGKLQISLPSTHLAVIKQLAELRESSVSGVVQEYLSRALAEHAKKSLPFSKRWRYNEGLYRKAFGCFICTDRYIRPWWWSFRHYLPTRPHPGAFFTSFVFRWLQLLFPPSSDDLTYDEIYAAWDVRERHSTPANTSKRRLAKRTVDPPRT